MSTMTPNVGSNETADTGGNGEELNTIDSKESVNAKAALESISNETEARAQSSTDEKSGSSGVASTSILNDVTSSKRFKRSRRRGRLHKRQLEDASVTETAADEVDSKRPKVKADGDNLQENHKETDWYIENGLRKIYPYRYTYLCYCKERWKGTAILDMLNNEFMSSSSEFHAAQIENGLVKVNGKQVQPKYVLQGKNELISNMVHRHELPITSQAIKIVANTDDYLAVDKPASIPVHPCGRYRHNSVIFMLSRDHGFHNLRTLYRLDRLTSGLLMFGKNHASTSRIMDQIKNREVSKTYLCRVEGEFPVGKIECEQPMDKVHQKIGTWRVKIGGKPSHTTFERVRYDGISSIVKCYPHTGRTHQIRVHLQYLGHPILNDPLYNDYVWGPEKGKGGHYGKSEEQLYKDLVELHSTKLFELPSTEMPTSIVKTNPAEIKEESHSDQDTSSHSLRLTPDPNCPWCNTHYKDPPANKLVIFLHALSYEGPGWQFSTEEPEWTKEDWNPAI